MYGVSASSIGSSHANGTGPMDAWVRWFNPYPIMKYARGDGIS